MTSAHSLRKRKSSAWRLFFMVGGGHSFRGKKNFTVYPLSSLKNPGTICSSFYKQLGKPRALSTPFHFLPAPPFLPIVTFLNLINISLFFPPTIFRNSSQFPVQLGTLWKSHRWKPPVLWEKATWVCVWDRICLLAQMDKAEIILHLVLYIPCL